MPISSRTLIDLCMATERVGALTLDAGMDAGLENPEDSKKLGFFSGHINE